MFFLSQEVSGASSPSHRQSCGMAELQACPLCSFQSYGLLICILCLEPCRDSEESNRDTQTIPLHPWHWPEAPRGLAAAIATGLFPLSHRNSSESVCTGPIDTASWGRGQWPSLCHDIALFPEQAPSSPQFSKLPLAQDPI